MSKFALLVYLLTVYLQLPSQPISG